MERVGLFVACLGDRFRPKTAVASVAVSFAPNQTCCGQFAYNADHGGRWP
jgi:Fe-S oxidoreductase